MGGETRIWEAQGDYRARATRGVAFAAVMLLLPFTAYALFRELYLVTLGGAYITAVLVINTQLVRRGLDHEPFTLYALIPGGILFMSLAFLEDGNMASVWCFPSILACYCMLGRRKAMISNSMILAIAVPMMWWTLEPVAAARLSASLCAVSLFASILVREIDAQQRRLRFQLDHDPLTGLLNRTSLKHRLQEAINAFAGIGTPAALLAIDLDHFKSINDRFGHDTGDLVLCEVARLLKQHVGTEGAVFRLGGEEFLVLLLGHDKMQAVEHAESLRSMIADTTILQGRSVTTSVGVAGLRSSDDRESWTQRSDNRLYAAKHAGRNQVIATGEVRIDSPPLADKGAEILSADLPESGNSADTGLVGAP